MEIWFSLLYLQLWCALCVLLDDLTHSVRQSCKLLFIVLLESPLYHSSRSIR